MPGKCKFNHSWSKDATIPSVAKWLRDDPKNSRNAICIYCKSIFSVEHAGIGAVRKHAAGVGHIKTESSAKQNTICFAAASVPTTTATTASPQPPNVQLSLSAMPEVQMRSFLHSEEVLRAEILWAIDRVMRHSSFCDDEEYALLFPAMFPDSTIASQFQMKKDKLAYIATYGIGIKIPLDFITLPLFSW